MARKDNRGRNLKVGESQRKDGLYMYRYTDERTGKRVAIYDADLAALREKERQIAREMDDGIVTDRAAKKLTVNALFLSAAARSMTLIPWCMPSTPHRHSAAPPIPPLCSPRRSHHMQAKTI